MPRSRDSVLDRSVEPLCGHENEIRLLFRSTFTMGEAISFHPASFDAYEHLSLGWYLENPDDSVVVLADGVVVGYALLCRDEAALNAWTGRRMLRFTAATLARTLLGRLDRKSVRFYRLRLMDAVTIARSRRGSNIGGDAVVHLNIANGHRSGWAALALLEAVDNRCRETGVSSWVGEINATEGSRERALRRVVGEVLTTAPNRTFSWLTGQKVTRLTVRRRVPVAETI